MAPSGHEMDLEEAIALGRQLKVEDIEHFNYDDLMLLAMRRGVETEYILPGTHNLLQAIVNHQSGPTSTLWGKPLPKVCLIELTPGCN